MDIETERERVEQAKELLHPDRVASMGKDEVAETVAEIKPEVVDITHDRPVSELFGLGAMHPNAYVRYHMLDVARAKHRNVFAREFIADLTHDDEDFVAFEALRLIGELNIQRAIDDLISISHWPSQRIEEGKKPVGVGHAVVLEAAFDVFGTAKKDRLETLEEHYQENGHLPLDMLDKPTFGAREDADSLLPSEPPEGMVRVPGGTYTIGTEPADLPTTRFDHGDYEDPYDLTLEPFYIDRYPVTNEEYDEFVRAVEGDASHSYCHPGEPEDKDHRRNTRDDDRVGPDHPATGLDYYDMYAYAQWAGKDLPIEEEWEVAVRGSSGNVFPWGDEWDPTRLNWAGNAFGEEFSDINDWRETLQTADRMAPNPDPMTTPVDAFPENESEFGVVDAVGNVWEYTKTNFYTRQEMYPVFNHPRRNEHTNLIEDSEAFPVIKGGAWSSIPEMTTAPYRGKDLMTDRHNEIGFRCVVRPGTRT